MSVHKFASIKAVDFLECSDKYNLNFKILPVLAFKESSGGKHFTPGTNIMGMVKREEDKDYLIPYPSIKDGICASAALLARLKPLTLEGKIKQYNSVNPNYWPDTKKLMNEISAQD